MNRLPREMLAHTASFMEAESLTTMTKVSRYWNEVMDGREHWKRAAYTLFPKEDMKVDAYLQDWQAMVYDRNRKNKKHTVIDYHLDYHQEVDRIYTKPVPLVGNPKHKVRLILDPFGNENVQLEEPCLSVYLHPNIYMEDHDVSLRFTIMLLRDPKCGPNRTWTCTQHFTKNRTNWGIHTLAKISELTPASGFKSPEGLIHLRVHVQIDTILLRIVDTLQNFRGLGWMGNSGTLPEGRVLQAMSLQTLGSLQISNVWVCGYRQGEGIVPLLRITKEQEQQPMDFLHEYQDSRGEVLLWATEQEGPFFRKPQDDGMGTWYVEKTLQPLPVDFPSPDHAMVLVQSTQDPRVEYKKYQDEAFAELQRLYDNICQHRFVSMEEILKAASPVYSDWRMVRFFQRLGNKRLFLQRVLQRPHLGYACDGCGKYHFTGTRYQCQDCSDYDLCETCHVLPIRPHRYVFQGGDHFQQTRYTEHQSSHTMLDIEIGNNAFVSGSNRCTCPPMSTHNVHDVFF